MVVIGQIPLINKILTSIIKYWYLKTKKFFSWPNIKAKKMIIPERIGNISPEQIASEASFLIHKKQRLQTIRDNLSKLRGRKGASKKLAYIIFDSIKKLS